jgi:spore coat polysaccharide biosynthesis predicted glycosyltransferase SpsG
VRLIIRADASVSVGTGHVMRSSTVAAEFVNLGHTVFYAGHINPLSLILERFQEIGVPNTILSPESFEPRKETDILLIDSYTLGVTDPFILRNRWLKSCSISDAITPDFDVDLVIKPSLVGQPYSIGNTRVLSGADFTLLRKSIKKNLPRAFGDVSPLRILIVGGGSDPSGFCSELVKTIRNFPNDFVVDVFSDNFETSSIPDARFRIHKVSLSIDEFAKNCDLVFTLASSSSLEFIAREIPVGVACAFENQKDGYRELVSSVIAAPIGERETTGKWIFNSNILERLINSETFRNQLRANSKGLIDMEGPERVVAEILKL